MVRRCVVQDCTESDKTILAHRFPKTKEIAIKWQNALDVDHYTLDDLIKKFVVCTKHFTGSSYRNEISNSLNTTAFPNLNENSCNQRIKLVEDSPKKHISFPVRCHRMPPIEICSPTNIKRTKFNSSLVSKCDQNDETELEETVEDDEETFEICEYAEVDPVFEDQIVKKTENIKQVEDVLLPVLKTLSPTQRTQETQTDPPPEIEQEDDQKVIAHVIYESKDDKLISILYPEYKTLEKLQLIELLNEKNRKIESLEDKVKKLELAMRNLL